MASKGMRHIDLCDDCLEGRAEFLIWITRGGLLGHDWCVRVLCKKCAKERCGKELRYEKEKW